MQLDPVNDTNVHHTSRNIEDVMCEVYVLTNVHLTTKTKK